MIKRTKQIDNARQVLLRKDPINGDIWTTAGELAMGGLDNEKLSSNLKAERSRINIQKIATAVIENAARFFEGCLEDLAPQTVLESYNGTREDEGRLFQEWIEGAGIGFKQDGLRSLVIYRGKVINELVADVDHRYVDEVVAEIAAIQERERQSPSTPADGQ